MSNPTFTRAQAEALARSKGCTDGVMIIGFRAAGSKYNQYDDTLAILTPDQYIEYKGNTLPSTDAPGTAVLQDGDYTYEKGLHGIHHFQDLSPAERQNVESWLNGHVGADYPPIPGKILPYWAFRQAGPVTVLRIGHTTSETIIDPNGWPWVDLHHGGWNGTSSLACQTWFPDHWLTARANAYAAMTQHGQSLVTYALRSL